MDTQNWNYRQWQDIHIYVLDKEPSNDVLTKLKTLHVLEKNPTSLRHKGKYKIVVISNKKDANELFQKGEIGIFTHTPCQKSSYARIR